VFAGLISLSWLPRRPLFTKQIEDERGREAASIARRALQFNVCSVTFGNPITHGESKTGSCEAAMERAACAVEPFEDAVVVVRGDADSCVRYADFSNRGVIRPIPEAERERYRLASGSVAPGVLEQDVQRAPEGKIISFNPALRRFALTLVLTSAE
jgi:hypothetical protein